MRRVAWVRPVVWCNTHDIPWASHSDLGVSTDGCVKGERFMKDEERADQVGECPGGEFLPEDAFEVQLSTDEDLESLDFQYWHQDLTDFVWSKGGWAWFVLVPIEAPALADQVGEPG